MADRNAIYLGGPIQHASDEDGHLDGCLKTLILYLVNILERAGYQVFSAHVCEDFGNLPSLSSTELVLRDYNWMRLCDVYAAIFVKNSSGKYIRSDGMHVEIGWASSMRKPIVLVGDDMLSEEHSHLIRGLEAISCVRSVSIADIERDPEVLIRAVRNAMEAASKRGAAESD